MSIIFLYSNITTNIIIIIWTRSSHSGREIDFCRLASRPSGAAGVGCVGTSDVYNSCFQKLAIFDFRLALTRSQPECFWPRRVSGGATQQPLAAARGRDASPLERRGGGVRHGGAPPGVESGQEHRHARRAVRTHLLRSHAIPRPAKDVPSESRRGPSGRPVKRDSLEAHAWRARGCLRARLSRRGFPRVSRPREPTRHPRRADGTRRPVSSDTRNRNLVVSSFRDVTKKNARARPFRPRFTTQGVPHDRRLGARHCSRRGRVPE